MRNIALLGAAAVMVSAVPAVSQNAAATATSGEISRSAGFTPDPITVQIYSGGGIDAAQAIGGSCVGMIAEAPDFEFTYTAGSWPLTFSVSSSTDTSLIINGPDGRWYCNDDSDGLDPVLRWGSPPSGTYDVWVGAVGQAGSSTLSISETR